MNEGQRLNFDRWMDFPRIEHNLLLQSAYDNHFNSNNLYFFILTYLRSYSSNELKELNGFRVRPSLTNND